MKHAISSLAGMLTISMSLIVIHSHQTIADSIEPFGKRGDVLVSEMNDNVDQVLVKRHPHPPGPHGHGPPHGPGPRRHRKRSLNVDQDEVDMMKRQVDFANDLEKRSENENLSDTILQKRCGGGMMAAPPGPQKRDLGLVDSSLEKRCGGMGAPAPSPQKRNLELAESELEKRQSDLLQGIKSENVLKKRHFGGMGGPLPPPFMGGGFHGPPPFAPFGGHPPFGPPPGMQGPPPGMPGMSGPPPMMGGGGGGGGGDAGGDAGDAGAAQKRDLNKETEESIMGKRGFENANDVESILNKRHVLRPGEKGHNDGFADKLASPAMKREVEMEKRVYDADAILDKRHYLIDGETPRRIPDTHYLGVMKRELKDTEESMMEKRGFEDANDVESILMKRHILMPGEKQASTNDPGKQKFLILKRDVDSSVFEKRNTHGHVFQPGFVGP